MLCEQYNNNNKKGVSRSEAPIERAKVMVSGFWLAAGREKTLCGLQRASCEQSAGMLSPSKPIKIVIEKRRSPEDGATERAGARVAGLRVVLDDICLRI